MAVFDVVLLLDDVGFADPIFVVVVLLDEVDIVDRLDVMDVPTVLDVQSVVAGDVLCILLYDDFEFDVGPFGEIVLHVVDCDVDVEFAIDVVNGSARDVVTLVA